VKIPNTSGEWAFKALVSPLQFSSAWTLTEGYFFDLPSVVAVYPMYNIRWPVEVMDNGSVYVADESEWK